MVSIMRICALYFFTILILSGSLSKAVKADPFDMLQQSVKPMDRANTHMQNIISELQDYATEINDIKLKRILQSTEITYTSEVSLANVAMSVNDDGRVIFISTSFIVQLHSFIHNLIPRFKSAETAFMLSEYSLFEHAISDILLHEMGHHVLEAFYSDYTHPQYIPAMEFAAQEWANQMKVNVEFDEDRVGKTVSLLFLLHHQLRTRMSQSDSVNRNDAIQYKIDAECDKSYSQISSVLCEEIAPNIKSQYKPFESK